MTTLLLIRHATNDWVKGRLAGWTPGVHLNEEGKQQANQLATRLAEFSLTAIYSSPLERAMETAQALAQPHAMQVHVVKEIGEVQYGEWTGGELKELAKHELWPVVQFYPSGARFPGGESLTEVQMRAVHAVDDLRTRHTKQECFVVVSHADVIKLVVAHYLGMHADLFQRLVINPASLTAFRFERMGPRLLALNETGSLEHIRPVVSDEAEPTTPESSTNEDVTGPKEK